MLAKYPTTKDFITDFKKYFRALNPQEVYPNEGEFSYGRDYETAKFHHQADYCLEDRWNPGCNEITFRKPLKIKVINFKDKTIQN